MSELLLLALLQSSSPKKEKSLDLLDPLKTSFINVKPTFLDLKKSFDSLKFDLPPPPSPPKCFVINEIEYIPSKTSLQKFSKEKIFDELSFLNNLSTFELGSCLTPADIAKFVQDLQTQSAKEGFVTTQFGLIPQDLKSGVLKIGIEVGRIRELFYNYGDTLIFYGKDFAINEGDILDYKEFEYGINNIKRLRYLEPIVKIKPTPFEGESDVYISLEKKRLPVYFQANLDNGGSTGVKEYGSTTLDKFKSFFTSNIQSSFVLGLENPAYLGDTLSFYVNNSIPYTKGHSLYASASYSIPIRRALIEFNTSFSHSASTLELDFSSPVSSSKSWNFNSKLSYLTYSSPFHTLYLGGGLNIKDNRSYLDKVELEVQRKFLSDLSLFLDYKYLFGASEFNLTFSLLQGIPIGKSNRIAGSNKPYLYTIPALDFYLNTPFEIASQSFNFSSLFKTQVSQNDLFASEKMSIGGKSSVRGFDGLSLSGQIGVLWRNDLVYYLPSFGGVTFAPALGIDAGYVQDFQERVDQYNFLSGGGVGLKMFAPYFNAELWYYYPIYNPYRVNTQTVYFNIGVSV